MTDHRSNAGSVWMNSELDELYPVPDHRTAEVVIDRFRHRDLRGRSFTSLRYEAERLLTRLGFEESPDPWLIARMRAIVRAMNRAR